MSTVQQNAQNKTPRPIDIRQWLGVSAERDRWQQLILATGRMMYAAGYADGVLAAKRDDDRRWAATPALHIRWGPSHTELERRRYGPGGRRSWIIPRDGE